jgi:hypothetical protein
LSYIIETLEPKAVDSFFKWNFFDTILLAKEHYSAYVFEELGAELFNQDATLKTRLVAREKENPAFAASGSAQLDFIYNHSAYREKEYLRYPVFRIVD